MNGLLLIDKPTGWTSFDVVAKVRGVLRAEAKSRGITTKIKVGHTGTLDPLATGLLVLAIGSYTKKVPELTKQDKVYAATITLGSTSNTDDGEGELTAISDDRPTKEKVEDALQKFVGELQQVPPQFSAIKIAGVRSYNAARSGKVVNLEPRNVTIYSISDIKYTYPNIHCTVSVGSGTYIRSLARDVGGLLKTGAYLSALRRTSIAGYNIANAISPENISSEIIAQKLLA